MEGYYSIYNQVVSCLAKGDMLTIDGKEWMLWKHCPPTSEYDMEFDTCFWDKGYHVFCDKDGKTRWKDSDIVLEIIQARLFYESQQKLNAKRK